MGEGSSGEEKLNYEGITQMVLNDSVNQFLNDVHRCILKNMSFHLDYHSNGFFAIQSSNPCNIHACMRFPLQRHTSCTFMYTYMYTTLRKAVKAQHLDIQSTDVPEASLQLVGLPLVHSAH